MKQSAVPSGKRWRQNASTSETTSFFAYLLKFRNMYRFYLLYCLFLCLGNILFAQTTGFEKGVPQSFCTVQPNELSSSEEFYKEGKKKPCMAILSPFRAHRQTRYSPYIWTPYQKKSAGLHYGFTTNKPEKIRCALNSSLQRVMYLIGSVSG